MLGMRDMKFPKPFSRQASRGKTCRSSYTQDDWVSGEPWAIEFSPPDRVCDWFDPAIVNGELHLVYPKFHYDMEKKIAVTIKHV